MDSKKGMITIEELEVRDNKIITYCPYNTEGVPNFIINVSKKTFECSGCGASGSFIEDEHEKN